VKPLLGSFEEWGEQYASSIIPAGRKGNHADLIIVNKDLDPRLIAPTYELTTLYMTAMAPTDVKLIPREWIDATWMRKSGIRYDDARWAEIEDWVRLGRVIFGYHANDNPFYRRIKEVSQHREFAENLRVLEGEDPERFTGYGRYQAMHPMMLEVLDKEAVASTHVYTLERTMRQIDRGVPAGHMEEWRVCFVAMRAGIFEAARP